MNRTAVAAAFACWLHCITATQTLAAEQFRADDWVSECEGARFGAGCSIMVPFGERSMQGVAGAFALAVDVESGMVAIVGKPPPLAATLQIDKNPPVRCTGPQYCIFSARGSLAAAQQLAAGSIALIDVATRGGSFHFSLGTQGFRAGLAKIKAWRSPVVGRARPAR